MIKSIYESSLDRPLHVENQSATATREPDFINNALAKMQLKSCRGHTLTELLDNLREVASIDDLLFQHVTPLETERETGSRELP